MKPKIQMQIGIWGAIVFTTFELVQFIRGQLSSSIGLWIILISLPLFAIYIFGIVTKKLRTIQIVFRIWCILASVTIGIIFIGLLLECEEAGESFLMLVPLIFLRFVVPTVIVVVILWVGLRGLKRTIEDESRLNEEKTSTVEKTGEK